MASAAAKEQDNLVASVFVPLPEGFGGETDQIDIASVTADRGFPLIRAAFRKFPVLAFRNQNLSDDQLQAFAALFGPLEENKNRHGSVVHKITNLDAQGHPTKDPVVNENYYWHSDKSYQEKPSLTTMLFAVEIPSSGGDTQFADMTAAYIALAAEKKRQINDLKAVHSWEYMRDTVTKVPASEAERRAAPPVVQPLVRTHPETGAKSLFLGMYCASIVGYGEKEGRALIDELLDHATKDEFVMNYQWRHGDFIMWDNRCLVHRAVANFSMATERRVLHRVVVTGEMA